MDLGSLDPQRILLVKPSALGDVMHALPTLAGLRERFPRAHLAWLVNRPYEPLLAHHPLLNATIPFDRHLFREGLRRGVGKAWSFAKALRAERFDLTIDLQGLLRTGLLSRLSGARVRLGLKSAREGASAFYTHRVDDLAPNLHAVDRYWRAATALGATGGPRPFLLPLDPEATRWAEERLASFPRPRIAVVVGARWLTKRWPPSHFAELVRRAHQSVGASAVFVGAPDERTLAEEAQRSLAGPSAVWSGETTLTQLAAVLGAADVVLANDTGPLHVAVALGRPVVSPFTCTSVRKTGPFGQFARAVETTVWCRASEVKTCDRLECMAELTPDRLWPALQEALVPWRRP